MVRALCTRIARRAWWIPVALLLASSCATESHDPGAKSESSRAAPGPQCSEDAAAGPECVQQSGCDGTIPHYAGGR
ncbi:MAG: hypothetical protein JRI23_07295, partial [Deltaproteobacteria bacterium]|nr:hypothetical protein [Deltaproteobacteria bacterium]MBW2531398.1 hypothetical protein [Deltaproteobacteria bacterium]